VLLIELTLKMDNFYDYLEIFIIITASASLIIGSVLGLKQNKLKRLLTYSTISHLAYIIIPLTFLSFNHLSSILFYIAQYTLTNINIFLIIIAMTYTYKHFQSTISDTTHNGGLNNKVPKDIDYISDLTMAVKYNPTLALSFAICLFSFSGIPPLAGF